MKDRDPGGSSDSLDDTLESESAGSASDGAPASGKRAPGPRPSDTRTSESKPSDARRRRARRREKLTRRHPDIEVARLLVKRGLIAKAPAVEALRTQKARAKGGKPRIPFVQLLVRSRVLDQARIGEAQDEIRRNTYICEACDARAVILAGSQTRAGACPRCGHEISVDPQSDPGAVPAREFQGTQGGDGSEATAVWRGPAGLVGNDAARRLVPGQVVFEKYLLHDELGRGAMGVVFRARHIGLNKDVALKVLVPTDDNREHQVARFRREAAAVQKLRHPGIIAVHDFGGDGDLYYLTMDLVEGGESLHRALKRRDPVAPLRRRLELVAQVGHAVGHAHERGVVHRDLKPANVLINPAGRALVADFGLAKDEDDDGAELTRTHDRLGTPLFMAPEQIRRGASEVDGRADVWALGVMLFVCVTGRYPFRSRTVMDLYLRIMKDEPDWSGTKYSAPDRPGLAQLAPEPSAPPPPDAGSLASIDVTKGGSTSLDEATEVDAQRVQSDGSLPKTLPLGRPPLPAAPPPFAPPPELDGREVPRDLKRVVECALSKHPEDRYATAEEFALDLERFLADRPVEARSPSLVTRARRALGRRRVIARVALAAIVLAIGLGGLIGVQAWQRGVERALRVRVDSLWSSTGAMGDYKAFVERLKGEPDLADHPEALLCLGVSRARLFDWTDAREPLERAARLADDAGDEGLAARVAVERAHLALITGDARGALEHALAAVSRSLPDARPVLYVGLGALALGPTAPEADLERAGVIVERAAALPDAPPQLVACAAQLALRRGRLDEARARLPAQAPDEWFDLTLARAAIALAERDLPAAEALFDGVRDQFRFQVLRERDPEVSYYNSQGYGRLMDRELHGALLADDAAAALSPWHAGPLYYAGRLLVGGYADPAAALPYFRRALARDPFHAQAREWAVAIHAAGPRPDLDQALALVQEERDLLPTSPAPSLMEAALQVRAGRCDLAWEALDEAQRRGERGPSLALLRGAALRRAQGAARDDLVRRAAGATFETPAALGGSLEAALRVEVARADLDAGDTRLALQVVLPAAESERLADRAQDSARLVAVRALAAVGERAAAVEALRWFIRWQPLRPAPPDLTPEALRAFPELQALRGDPSFQEVVAELELRRAAPRPLTPRPR